LETNNKPVAIALGGTGPSIAVIENLKNRGFYVILIDYLENPPAKPFADEHMLVSTLDKEGVLEVAKKTNASYVINLLLDQPMITAAYVAEKLKLPSFMSYETSQLVTNKKLMKKRMVKHKIPTAKYSIINSSYNVDNINLDFPLVIKPIEGTGSIGIKRVNNFDELRNYLQDNIRDGYNEDIIIEEHYKGIEIQVNCFIYEKNAHILMIMQKEKVSYDECDLITLGSLVPAQISQQAENEIYVIAQKLVKAFELDNTPMHFQAFVEGDNVNIIEVAARIGGVLSYNLIKIATGFDILDYSLDVLIGKSKCLHYYSPKYIYSTIIIYAQSSVFGKVTGLNELIEQKIILYFILLKTEGMFIPSGINAYNRVAAFIISAESKEQMVEKIDYAFQRINVFDIEGNSVMMKNLRKSVF
jgi:carbamoylphosphate synthase large subunit